MASEMEKLEKSGYMDWARVQFERHQFELFLTFIFLVCVANYFVGSLMNRRHA
jgi:hypothetical protein